MFCLVYKIVCFHSTIKHEIGMSNVVDCLKLWEFTVWALNIIFLFVNNENNNFIKELKHVVHTSIACWKPQQCFWEFSSRWSALLINMWIENSSARIINYKNFRSVSKFCEDFSIIFKMTEKLWFWSEVLHIYLGNLSFKCTKWLWGSFDHINYWLFFWYIYKSRTIFSKSIFVLKGSTMYSAKYGTILYRHFTQFFFDYICSNFLVFFYDT